MSDINLKDWYEQLNEDDFLPNGAIKINAPVIDADSGERVVSAPPQVADDGTEMKPKSDDPVVDKDKDKSLKAFIYAKRMQDLLIKIAGLVEPYESDSEVRQALVDKLKYVHEKMGEEIASL